MIRVNQNLAYWIGVLQTDGSLSKSNDIQAIEFGVEDKSLPMLEKFSRITKENFWRDCKISRNKLGYNIYKVSVKRLLKNFDLLGIKFGDPPKPTSWISDNTYFFGPYLAGVIDGDGDVRIKRQRYPQCVVRITSGSEPRDLMSSIENVLSCKVSSTERSGVRYLNGRRIEGKWWETEFYVSKKNRDFLLTNVLPHLAIKHKSDKIRDFIDEESIPDSRLGRKPIYWVEALAKRSVGEERIRRLRSCNARHRPPEDAGMG